MNSYPQAEDGGNKCVEGLATGGLLAGLGYFSLNPKRRGSQAKDRKYGQP